MPVGVTLVNMGQDEPRGVRFSLPAPGPSIELTGLRDIIRRGGRREFLSTQRLEFELLYLVEAGSTVHEVDFVSHRLGPGDALWVRPGQVHRWGDISTLSGRVALFPSHAIPPEVQEALVESGYAGSTSRITAWTAPTLERAGVRAAWRALHAGDAPGDHRAVRSLLREVALSAVLLRLATAVSDGARTPPGAIDDREGVHAAFVAEVEAHHRDLHLVSDYASRLGWSAKTLGRATAPHGVTPKQVIDARLVLEAKRLLVHTTQSVGEVGAHLGFADASNFSSFFRLRTGSTPGAVRGRQRVPNDVESTEGTS